MSSLGPKCLPEPCDSLSPHLVDLCAGMGAMSIGPQFLGCEPMVAVDWNPLAIEHLRANHPGTVLHLDLTARDAARQVHQACTHPTLLFGFPCQPHSQQGRQLGCADERAKVLWHGLHVAYMIQPQALILECTPAAGQNEEVQNVLSVLAQAMNLDFLSVDLDLQSIWPCKRKRWWALLLPNKWNKIGISQWNVLTPFDRIGAILNDWGLWHLDDESSLQLTPHEQMMFDDPSYGDDVRHLDLTHVAATLLHSYGNALRACPCGCRAQGFHPMTLLQGGLRGFYVTSKMTGQPRFLHPHEAGLLLGLPASVNYVHDARAALALLGLVASPLQSLWTYGFLKKNHWLATQTAPCPAVETWLQAYCQELLEQAHQFFDLAHLGTHQVDIHSFGASVSLPLRHVHTSGLQLLHAERISLGWNEGAELWLQDGQLRLWDPLLQRGSDTIQLRCLDGLPERVPPAHPIVLAINRLGEIHVQLIAPGTFLFEALADLGCPLLRNVIDSENRVLPADFRLWHPMAVWTLTTAPWHQPRGFFRCAHGFSSSHLQGLHDGHIWACTHSLLQGALLSSAACLVIHPATAAALRHDWISPPHFLQLQQEFQRSSGCIICIYETNGHWILLWGLVLAGVIHWTSFDGLYGFVSTDTQHLTAAIAGILGLDFCPPQHSCVFPQLDPYSCGTIALVHLGWLLHPGLTVTSADIQSLHLWILNQTHLTGSIFATGINTLSTDQVSKLIGLLVEPGVPESKAPERAQLVIQKIGAPAIIAAFVAKNSWAQLKIQANKPGAALRLVHPDELAQHAETMAAKKYGAGISNHKAKKKQDKQPVPVPSLDPAALLLQPGHFKDQDGDEVPQIAYDDLQAEAHGIAITTLAQGQHWQQQPSSISTSALAILITEELPADIMEKYDAHKMTFAATYKGTGEPVLVFGSMKNLGDQKVNRHLASDVTQVDIVDNTVIRFHVYRDELSISWHDFIQSPVRALCQLLPTLQLLFRRRLWH